MARLEVWRVRQLTRDSDARYACRMRTTLLLLLVVPLGLAIADAPPPRGKTASGNFSASRKALDVAYDKLSASITNKEIADHDGHAAKAKKLLEDARAELKLAADGEATGKE